jgi:hypothetical protein
MDIQYALLSIKASKLDDLERVRIATENRLRSLVQVFNLDENHEVVQDDASMLEQLQALEAEAIKELQQLMKEHPMYPFMKRVQGIGAKQFARLLGAIGDPYMRPPIFDRETQKELEPARPRRGPAELWQYCGVGDPERSRRVKGGGKIHYDPKAKVRIYLVAEKCIMFESKYRDTYDEERDKKLDAVHTKKCPQCKDTGGVGQPWKPGHQHRHALRVVSDDILADMWLYSKRLHEAEAAAKVNGRPKPRARRTVKR